MIRYPQRKNKTNLAYNPKGTAVASTCNVLIIKTGWKLFDGIILQEIKYQSAAGFVFGCISFQFTGKQLDYDDRPGDLTLLPLQNEGDRCNRRSALKWLVRTRGMQSLSFVKHVFQIPSILLACSDLVCFSLDGWRVPISFIKNVFYYDQENFRFSKKSL